MNRRKQKVAPLAFDSLLRALPQAAALLAVATLTACTAVTAKEDKTLHSERTFSFDGQAYGDKIWRSNIAPIASGDGSRTVGMTELASAVVSGHLRDFGEHHAHQAGVDSPYTFLVAGDGVVTEVNQASPLGYVALRIDGTQLVHVAVGPLILSTALRDALPSISFDQVPDQMAYGALAKRLNTRAMQAVAPAVARAKVGQKIHFVGAVALAPRERASILTIVPLNLSVGGEA